MSNITKTDSISPGTLSTMDVDLLAELANTSAEAHQGLHKQGLEAAYVAGQALNEAKSRLKHGEWGAWVKKNFLYSQQWACAYMKLAKLNRVEISEADGIKAAIKMLSGPSGDIDDSTANDPIPVIEGELMDNPVENLAQGKANFPDPKASHASREFSGSTEQKGKANLPDLKPTVTVVERGKPSQTPAVSPAKRSMQIDEVKLALIRMKSSTKRRGEISQVGRMAWEAMNIEQKRDFFSLIAASRQSLIDQQQWYPPSHDKKEPAPAGTDAG